MEERRVKSIKKSLVSLYLLALVFAACSADPELDGDADLDSNSDLGVENELILAPEVRLLEQEPALESVEVEAGRLSFTFSEPTDLDVQIGSVLVGESAPGYLRRVTDVIESTSTRLVVETEQATFTEAITEGRIKFSAAELEEVEDGLRQQPLSLSRTITLNETLINSPEVTLSAAGSLNLNINIEMDLLVENSRVSHFSLVAHGSSQLDYTATATLGASLSTSGSRTIEVVSLPFRFAVPTPIGIPFPVVGTIDLIVVVSAGGSISATGSLSTGVRAQADLRSGITYNGSQWSEVWVPLSGNSTLKPLNWDVDASIGLDASIAPEVQLNFYGVGGPRAGFKRYLALSGTFLPCPPSYTAHHGESTQVRLHIDVPVIDATLSHTFTSTEQRWLLSQGELENKPCCGDEILQQSEVCDGSNLDGQSCESLGYTSGTLSCEEDCSGFDESECNLCGNGQVDEGEDCDGSVGATTCEDLDRGTGDLACANDCTWNVSGCTCGNGIIDVGEVCDGFNLDGESCSSLGEPEGELGCADNCRAFDLSRCTCGNGIVDPGEDCDGSNLDGKSCEDLGHEAGDLGCNDDCTFDTSECLECETDEDCADDEVCESNQCKEKGAACEDHYDCNDGEICVSDFCIVAG